MGVGVGGGWGGITVKIVVLPLWNGVSYKKKELAAPIPPAPFPGNQFFPFGVEGLSVLGGKQEGTQVVILYKMAATLQSVSSPP